MLILFAPKSSKYMQKSASSLLARRGSASRQTVSFHIDPPQPAHYHFGSSSPYFSLLALTLNSSRR